MTMTTAVAAGVIMASLPAVVAVLSWAFLRERIECRTALGIALAAAGIALFSLHKSPGSVSPQSLWGNALVFAAVVCEASYVVIGKRLTEGLSPRRISAIINAWGLVLMTPFGLWTAWRFDFANVSLGLWTLLLFYGLAASVWTVWLWMQGLKSVPASRAGVFTIMLPISTASVGVGIMGETLSVTQWLAFALALGGLVLATTGNTEPTPSEAP